MDNIECPYCGKEIKLRDKLIGCETIGCPGSVDWHKNLRQCRVYMGYSEFRASDNTAVWDNMVKELEE